MQQALRIKQRRQHRDTLTKSRSSHFVIFCFSYFLSKSIRNCHVSFQTPSNGSVPTTPEKIANLRRECEANRLTAVPLVAALRGETRHELNPPTATGSLARKLYSFVGLTAFGRSGFEPDYVGTLGLDYVGTCWNLDPITLVRCATLVQHALNYHLTFRISVPAGTTFGRNPWVPFCGNELFGILHEHLNYPR